MVKTFMVDCLEMLDVYDVRDPLICWLYDWFFGEEQRDVSDGEEKEIEGLYYIASRYEAW